MTRRKALEMTRWDYNVSCDVQSRSIINSIFDDIDKQICENCEYFRIYEENTKCSISWITVGDGSFFYVVSNDFGCNKFVAKESQ